MDLNQLLHAHQIALVGESRATTRAGRDAFGDAITLLAARIRHTRTIAGADVTAARFVVGEPVEHYRDR
ncbi:hypothetical protein [Erythrobacter donghaensis]|uniref:hypothetical protein n=1 Tax=Erythrobacter donghaensis TaxID=267135 RepID=UPI000A367FA7|nr:hypothetical protein [Erythrobacter donghaensis]